MKILVSASLLSLLVTLSAVAQNKSVYTSTTTGCRTISSDPSGAGSYEGECPGIGGYRVRLLEGDIRQTLNIVTPAKKTFELNFWSYYGGFSSIGEKIEWRTKTGVPVALIARFNVAGADDSTKSTSYLMISKIGKTESCVTDIVLPQADQNVEARKLADAAAGKPCKKPEN